MVEQQQHRVVADCPVPKMFLVPPSREIDVSRMIGCLSVQCLLGIFLRQSEGLLWRPVIFSRDRIAFGWRPSYEKKKPESYQFRAQCYFVDDRAMWPWKALKMAWIRTKHQQMSRFVSGVEHRGRNRWAREMGGKRSRWVDTDWWSRENVWFGGQPDVCVPRTIENAVTGSVQKRDIQHLCSNCCEANGSAGGRPRSRPETSSYFQRNEALCSK